MKKFLKFLYRISFFLCLASTSMLFASMGASVLLEAQGLKNLMLACVLTTPLFLLTSVILENKISKL